MSVAAATPRSRLVTLDLREQPFEFRPGQAVLIGAPGAHPRRPYSISCSPERAAETRTLELLIALEADGTLGPHLAAATPGSPIDLEGPLGTFLFPEDPPPQRLLFVAGGTGNCAAASDDRPRAAPGSGSPGLAALQRPKRRRVRVHRGAAAP